MDDDILNNFPVLNGCQGHSAVIKIFKATCVCLLPTELTNLIIMRNSSFVEAQLSPTLEGNKLSHIQFQMIKYEDLQWVRRFYLHCLLEKPHTQTYHFLSCVVAANFTVSEVTRCFSTFYER